MIGPDASAVGFARRSSSASATSSSFSSSSSRFSFCLAETSANWVVPPHSSGCSPSEASSERTRSRFAFGTSILLTATTIGTPAARACEIDSRVCGITPSSAATTRIAMSVTFAPRARMAVNASWPGVSRKVILRPSSDGLVGADVLRDPARLGVDDRRLADRVEQRRLAVVDVAHDRHDRRARGELVVGVLEDLGLGVVVGRVLDDDLALDLGRDQHHRVVAERLRDRDHLAEAHHDLDDLRNRDPERGGEILDADAGRDGDRPGRRRDRLLPRLDARGGAAVARLASVAAARVAAVDDDAALAAGRAAARADRAVRLVGLVSHQSCQCSGARDPARRARCGAAPG